MIIKALLHIIFNINILMFKLISKNKCAVTAILESYYL